MPPIADLPDPPDTAVIPTSVRSAREDGLGRAVNRLLTEGEHMPQRMKTMTGGGLRKMMKRMGGMKGLPGMGGGGGGMPRF